MAKKETTELEGKQYRSSITDNPGSAPYLGGTDAGKGSTNQDDKGDANFYEEKSNDGVGDEHQESAADGDVDTYYRELSERRPPNYSKNANLSTKQAPLDQAPVDGGDGFVGSNTGPAVSFNYITGKKGYSEDVPVWEKKSSFTNSPDNTGSTGNVFSKPGEDSRDEFAPWKHVQTDEGLPQTHRKSAGAGDAGPAGSDEPDKEGIFGAGDDGGGQPDTQPIPSAESGDTDTAALPKTLFTENDGGGAPLFKHSSRE